MPVMRWVVVLSLGALLVACDKPKAEPRYAVTTTTTRPVEAEPGAGNPPATLPTSSTLFVGNQLVSFPRARLMVQDTQPEMVLLLFSDDPRDALHPDYKGNRFYFQITLDINDLAELGATDWHFKAASIERTDTPNGIFLNGDRQHLQPYDMTIVFTRQSESQVGMALGGQFLAFQGEAGPPHTALVQGTLVAELELPRRLRKGEPERP